MRVDLYTRMVLTAIAAALLYLCVILTPLPTASAQTAQRPGMPTGPAEVVVIGWRPAPQDRVAVQVMDSVPIKVTGDVRVTGNVRTRQEDYVADRVVLAGWEERAGPNRSGSFEMFDARPQRPSGLPVTTLPVR